MPFSCSLRHRWTSALQELHITVATHNCGISSMSRVHPPGNAPYIPSLINPRHTLLSCTILLAYLTSKPLFFNPPLPRPTHWATTNTPSYIDPLSSPVIFILSTWLNYRRTPSLIFSSTPFFTPHNCLICEFGTLSILLKPNRLLRLSICTAQILDLFSPSISLFHCHT